MEASAKELLVYTRVVVFQTDLCGRQFETLPPVDIAEAGPEWHLSQVG